MSKRTAAAVAAMAACLVGFGPAVASAASTPTPAQRSCDRAPWQAKIQGRPDYHAGTGGGDYLWHDRNGFHLRVTHHRNDRAVFGGQIVSTAPMRKDAVRLEGRDVAALSANRKVLTFRFYNYGHTDGINFHTDCARELSVRWLHRDGEPLAVSHINLGARSAHPAHVPFTVHRAS